MPKKIRVRSYKKKDGTRVKSHLRRLTGKSGMDEKRIDDVIKKDLYLKYSQKISTNTKRIMDLESEIIDDNLNKPELIDKLERYGEELELLWEHEGEEIKNIDYYDNMYKIVLNGYQLMDEMYDHPGITKSIQLIKENQKYIDEMLEMRPFIVKDDEYFLVAKGKEKNPIGVWETREQANKHLKEELFKK